MPTALVTGASTGIGRATALKLAGAGWTVLAGVRTQAAADELRAQAGASDLVQPLILDVTEPDQVRGASERIGGGALDALVNNAGIAVSGPLELVALDELRRQFEVNVFGQVALVQALLPALRRGRTNGGAGGRIVFVSSIGGLVTMPFTAPYGASKHAIEGIADALRGELRSSGVQVALVEPGSVATPIWEKARGELEATSIPPELEREYGTVPAAMAKAVAQTAGRGIAPELVAARIERALGARRMRARYLIGRDARGMLAAKRLLPDLLFDRIVRRALGL